ncbi:MAG: hypothetical protein U0667_03275 [Chloroflexota bacterium]
MSRTPRRGLRPAIALTSLALLLSLVAGVPAVAQDDPTMTPDPGLTIDPGIPGEPGGEFGEPGESPEVPFGDGATPVTPEDGLDDIIDTPWDHISVGPDGRTLTVYFWSGADSCYGLAGVTVDTSEGAPVITLQTGTRPGVDVCIAIAQLYSTQVVLDEPIVGGGVQ